MTAMDPKSWQNPVHQRDNQWWWWDETWSTECGPYPTEDAASEALKRYCKEELGWYTDG